MRQAGILAAAGLIALEKGPARLHQDHENARFLAEGLARIPGVRITPAKVKTNILVFDISGTGMSSEDITSRMAAKNVLASGVSSQAIRLVTHVDVDRTGCARALDVIQQICR
jgi:threonine aldolase